MKSNIILSGGWGYGNLGDDAILLSSIKLIQGKNPNRDIFVITNNPMEIYPILIDYYNIHIVESIYKSISGNQHTVYPGVRNLLRQSIVNKIHKIFGRNKSKIIQIIKSPDTFIKQHNDVIKNFEELCESSEVYLMSGGGYINNWIEMGIVKFIEVYIASKKGLKCYMLGQTIGPFKNIYSFNLAKSICSLMQKIYYRDIESVKDGERMGVVCEIIPDLALSEEFYFVKQNKITIIPFNQKIVDNIDIFIKNIKQISESVNNAKVVVAVSQWWYTSINIAVFIHTSLLQNNINAEIAIPSNVLELQRILGESKLVISQNLHGLILAYRGHTPIISLNSARKFISFMEMTGNPDLIIEPDKMENKELVNLAKQALSSSFCDNVSSLREEISEKVEVFFD